MHGNANDLTGEKFGRLTALEPTEERQGSSIIWLCQCSCGNTTLVGSGNLRGGNTQSCGCSRAADLRGQKFGRLTALEPTEERSGGHVVWSCRCSCGNETLVRSSSLRNAETRSCGCLQREGAARMGRESAVDLAGQQFGRLTAIEPTEERAGHNVIWRCECSCGQIVLVSASDLRQGNTRSCGCLWRELCTLDLRGQHFGRLVALEPTEGRVGGHVIWRCSCICGNETLVSSDHLRRGDIRSCGCLQTEMRKERVGENSPNWRGGHENYYGTNWHAQRRAARKRDNYICQECGITEDELDRELDVHHKIRFAAFGESEDANQLSNLISLCPSCHKRREHEGYEEIPLFSGRNL